MLFSTDPPNSCYEAFTIVEAWFTRCVVANLLIICEKVKCLLIVTSQPFHFYSGLEWGISPNKIHTPTQNKLLSNPHINRLSILSFQTCCFTYPFLWANKKTCTFSGGNNKYPHQHCPLHTNVDSIPGVGTPIRGHGREVPRRWPPFWDFHSDCVPILYLNTIRYWPSLSAEKVGLSLSHLVPDILGPKVGSNFTPKCII